MQLFLVIEGSKPRGCLVNVVATCNLDYDSFRHFKRPRLVVSLKSHDYDVHLISRRANDLNKELNQHKKIGVIAQKGKQPFFCI